MRINPAATKLAQRAIFFLGLLAAGCNTYALGPLDWMKESDGAVGNVDASVDANDDSSNRSEDANDSASTGTDAPTADGDDAPGSDASDDGTTGTDAPVADGDNDGDPSGDANDGGTSSDVIDGGGSSDAPGIDGPLGGDAPITGDVVITTSRVSGAAPLAVFFDSTATICAGCDPFHDLDHEWDFGDPTAGTWSVSDKSKNQAFGPVTAHVFETPGSFVVNLVVYGSGGARRQQVAITVTDGNAEWAGTKTTCLSTSGNFADCPAGAAQVSASSTAAIQTSCNVANHRCLLRRGEIWTGAALSLTVSGPSMIGAYGSGAKPVVDATDTIFLFEEKSSDWRVTDLRCRGATNANAMVFGAKHTLQNVLLQRIESEPGTLNAGVSFHASVLNLNNDALHDGLFFVENAWNDMGVDGARPTATVAGRRVAFLGNTFIDAESAGHVLWMPHLEKGVIAHNELARQANGKRVIIIDSADQNGTCTAGCGFPARDVVIADNIIRGRDDSYVSFTSEAVTTGARGINYLVERNFFTQATTGDNGSSFALHIENTEAITIRNNLVRMDAWQGYRAVDNYGTKGRAYNNSCVVPSVTANVTCVGSSTEMIAAYNNLLYAPQATGTAVAFSGTATSSGANVRVTTNPFIAADPLNPADFQLKVGSPGIDMGSSALYPRLDFQLTSRPQGTGWISARSKLCPSSTGWKARTSGLYRGRSLRPAMGGMVCPLARPGGTQAMNERAHGASILVVDDTPENLRLLTNMLAEQGYEIRPVTSGRQALQAARQAPPELILLDVNMPEMNGYEVCERFKAIHDLKNIPIIFLTALTDTADKVRAFNSGAPTPFRSHSKWTRCWRACEPTSRFNRHAWRSSSNTTACKPSRSCGTISCTWSFTTCERRSRC